jgi:hypothetical protein
MGRGRHIRHPQDGVPGPAILMPYILLLTPILHQNSPTVMSGSSYAKLLRVALLFNALQHQLAALFISQFIITSDVNPLLSFFFVFTLYTAIGRQLKLLALFKLVQLGAGWKGTSLKLRTSGYNDLLKINESEQTKAFLSLFCFRSRHII